MSQKKKPKIAAPSAATKVLDRALSLVIRTLSKDDSATNLLIRQHQEVTALFKRLEKAPTKVVKGALFEELARNLAAHDAIEREIFYPACERAMGTTDLLGEALVEHGVVEFCLYQADQAQGDDDFPFQCQVLSEIVAHHVKEEERELFPQAEKALGEKKLAELGARMKARFAEVKARDFRGPLADNLKQVLAGALKPVKRTTKTKRKAVPKLAKTGRRQARRASRR